MQNMPVMSVRFFMTDSGAEPVRDWLKYDLSEEERKIVGRDIKIIQFSWPEGMPLVKPPGEGLWELRSSFRDKIARVIFTIHSGQFILLHGFVKKDRKIRKKDLEIALRCKSLFKRG